VLELRHRPRNGPVIVTVPEAPADEMFDSRGTRPGGRWEYWPPVPNSIISVR
jgi:hypothetical protein